METLKAFNINEIVDNEVVQQCKWKRRKNILDFKRKTLSGHPVKKDKPWNDEWKDQLLKKIKF